ncbi:acyl dehydratase [Glaciihabitans tibetensis]|uniref:Acyl dehydratase n=1 Tax=Glaciihabitans tibetensis TaxID=1266600 RepID=A0A2T0VG67_9MICO|nr:MaoC family dehydratase [Glaciihabitans tibetensis]PRY69166.1 acyl dehydratase [Glaciihabitans tibetensis]
MNDFFAVPLADRHFEDYRVGATGEYGSTYVSEESIVAFAEEFDPHLMHTDPIAALAGPFGGLIASGWHTTSMMMRIMVDNYLNERTSLGSPGVDELRWHLPVRAGDTLSVRFTVVAARKSNSRPDRGLLHTRIELFNQRGEVVMSQTMLNLISRRERADVSTTTQREGLDQRGTTARKV